ncbi:Stk1 family PASTA domain-containing Ser/Thr kinase [Peptoniphilus sp. GNH]|nr:kinase domain protein [Clostridiales bacterium KA00134]UHR02984.1 Stk1 family PASTA domain-containing Ser/Thr kinase [Peptoniphilus sp. GNH]
MIGKLLGNRYEILQKIGTGGMGDVYKAHCHKLDRIVAIKILKIEYNDDMNFIRKFRRESLAAASISHPNIVSIYDVGSEEVDGQQIHYIVMEYIDGKTLKEIVNSEGPLKQSTCLNYTIQIAEALKVAHAKKIVHRDIKSQNIMVTRDERVKVTDFGIARVADNSTMTATNAVMGSVHYFSPEQARGAKVDNRSDIYSLGIVLFEMLTGKVPFDADNPVSVALMQVQSNLPEPSSLNPSIDKVVDKLVLKMTRKNPDERYKDADELIKDIKAIILNRPEDLTLTSLDSSSLPSENIKNDSQRPVKKVIRRDSDDRLVYPGKQSRKSDYGNTHSKKSKSGVILGIITAILFAALLIYVVPKVLPLMNNKNDSQSNTEMGIVPNLVGQVAADAEKLANDAGFTVKVGEAKSDLTHKDGEILEQDKTAGTSLEKNSPITVVINKLKDINQVPDLSGKKLEEAQALISERGYSIGELEQKESDQEPNTILDQSPKPGETLEKDGKINLVVSRGGEIKMKKVPNLKGLTRSQAKEALEVLGFNVGKVEEGRTNEVGRGDIFEQSLESGKEYPEGSSVDLKISIGPLLDDEKTDEKSSKTREFKSLTIPIKSFSDGQSHSIKIEMINDEGRRNIKTERFDGDGVEREVEVKAEVGSTIEIQIDNVTVESREVK